MSASPVEPVPVLSAVVLRSCSGRAGGEHPSPLLPQPFTRQLLFMFGSSCHIYYDNSLRQSRRRKLGKDEGKSTGLLGVPHHPPRLAASTQSTLTNRSWGEGAEGTLGLASRLCKRQILRKTRTCGLAPEYQAPM